jgi:hypothetical protein
VLVNGGLQVLVNGGLRVLVNGGLKVLVNGTRSVSGAAIDDLLVEHFATQFTEKYKVDARTNTKASIRLRSQVCSRANMAHTRQSRPYSGLGLQVEILKTF